MAKFALECPKCGSLNTASTFLFAKKVIQCGVCGEEIDVAQSRMISKKCSNCGKVVVCDQAKLKNKKCPSCGESFGVATATEKYQMGEIACPQCFCQIEIDKTKELATCPVCDKVIYVKEALAKADLVKDTGVSVIKYEGDNSTFIWKHPIEDFNWGSQLIVHESQEAIFFFNGKALDLFGPGRHILETENLPILKNVYDMPSGKQTPFHAEVYFINKTVQMGIKWGTDSRVHFKDPATSISFDIGASGTMNVQVSNGRKLLLKLVGTTSGLTRSQLLETGTSSDERGQDEYGKNRADSLKSYFKPLVMTIVKTNLAATIKAKKIDILEIDEHLEELSYALKEKISSGFEEYGLFVPQFYVTNVSLPENDPRFMQHRDLLEGSYFGMKAVENEANIEAERRRRRIELEQLEEETNRIKAEAEAERERIKIQTEAERDRMKSITDSERIRDIGFAQADVMKAKGYDQKDVIRASVEKEFAKGIGNMGGNGGSMMSDMLGIGVGMAAVDTMVDKMKNMAKGLSETESVRSEAETEMWTCTCGKERNTGKYCSKCGKPKQESWDCSCGRKGNVGKFCSECGMPKQESWDCPCGQKGNTGKFCSECGMPKQESWDCSCGKKGNTGKFCSECGAEKEDN